MISKTLTDQEFPGRRTVWRTTAVPSPMWTSPSPSTSGGGRSTISSTWSCPASSSPAWPCSASLSPRTQGRSWHSVRPSHQWLVRNIIWITPQSTDKSQKSLPVWSKICSKKRKIIILSKGPITSHPRTLPLTFLGCPSVKVQVLGVFLGFPRQGSLWETFWEKW